MSTTFRPYAPDQSLLLPPDVREWLPEGHLAHHVSDLVDDLDLTAFYVPYEGDGRRNAPYEPRMMVKVLLYAYATGVFSSRRIARKLEEDVAFRVLAAGNFPQHRTLCEFRRRHLEDFQALFVKVVRLAQELGLARLGKLSIDGTKVRANASKHKAMSYDRMQEEEQRLESEIEALVRQAEAVDEAEDARLGVEVRGDDLPAELRRREERLAAIRAAKARLEAKQRAADDARGRQPGQDRNPKGGPPYKRAYGEPDPKAQSNFTDPESSIMKTSSAGFQQCYNAQAAVDAEHQLVVATDLTANASDQGELPVVARCGEGDVRRAAGDGAGRCGVLQRAGTCRTWRNGALTGMWQRAGRASRRLPAIWKTIRRRVAWWRSWRRQRAGRRMRSASGCRRHPTAGSSTCWASGASAYVDWRRCGASGTWCAWR